VTYIAKIVIILLQPPNYKWQKIEKKNDKGGHGLSVLKELTELLHSKSCKINIPCKGN
jgi:hypothetical protein